MNLHQTCSSLLDQFALALIQLQDEHFSRPMEILNKATIGQHVRHTLEFFICLEQGYEKGIINYDNRARNTLIETDRSIAIKTLNHINEKMHTEPINKSLQLELNYGETAQDLVIVKTNYLRELIYVMEHTIHHMAIIKIGILEIAKYVVLPIEFGVAASTLRYKKMTA